MDLLKLTIKELREKLKNKEVTSVELTETFFKRIEEVEDKVEAFMLVTKDEAMEQAKAADERIAAGEDTPLLGIPVSVKDLFCTKDITTTCSSKILENFVPPYDATVVKKLKEAGAVIVAKNNMDEFAMGSSTENSAYKKTKNPWDLTRVPGGSSGGSAASVASLTSVISIGTDTGGSIRQPASCCGIVGLKPTYGRCSRFGMIAFASSLDQAGPFAKTVEDAALTLNVIAGHDEMDSTSVVDEVPDFTSKLGKDIKGLKIGLPKEYFIKGMEEGVEERIKESIEKLKDLGAKIKEISLPHTEYAVSVYYLIATAEASANLARFDGIRYGLRVDNGNGLNGLYKDTREQGFGAEVKRRIMLGTYGLSAGYYDAYYEKASRVRTLIKQDFDNAFKECDVILTPTAATTAFKIGERSADPLTMYLSDIFTISTNLAGLPGISVPCGFSNDMPVGLQFIGNMMDEETMLQVAHAYEQATDFHKQLAEVL